MESVHTGTGKTKDGNGRVQGRDGSAMDCRFTSRSDLCVGEVGIRISLPGTSPSQQIFPSMYYGNPGIVSRYVILSCLGTNRTEDQYAD